MYVPGINDFNPRTSNVKDEESDLVTDSHHILVMWQNHFSLYLVYMGLVMLGRQHSH